MIPFPTKKYFRLQLIFGLLIYLLMLFVFFTGCEMLDDVEMDLISRDNYGSIISDEKLWLLSAFVVGINVCGIVGMIFFQGWGRFLLLGGLLVDFLMAPFLGMYITTGLESMLWFLAEVLVAVPWVLSFFEPCSGYFEKEEVKLAE